MPESYSSLQKPVKVSDIEKGLAPLMIVQEFLHVWKQGTNSKPHPYLWALITSYEATDLMKYLYYNYQGRIKKRDTHQLRTMMGDLLAMSMTLCDDLGLDLYETVKETLTKLENLEYKKSGDWRK